ncbi:MAG: type I 3-dehydroquinate dehydratase [Syntrophobacteraceae bacterium]
MTTHAVLCGCLTDVDDPDQVRLYLQHPEIDLLEWRLDSFIHRHSLESTVDALRNLSVTPRLPVLATNRPKREGGAYEGSEEARIKVLRKAVESGAEWVDIEDDVPAAELDSFRSEKVQVLLSHHDFNGTPTRSALQKLAERMAQKETHAVKIVTHAHTPEDNLKVLELIPFGRRELGRDVIAFCMGPLGRWSRLACILLGSPWTYVHLPAQPPAAPGQLNVEGMRALLDIMLQE